MGHGVRTISRVIAFGIAACVSAGASSARGQGNHIDWLSVGDPGNRDTHSAEVPWWSDLEIGGVDHRYRIARTELTVRDHFEYVQAYWQYVPPEERLRSGFLGEWIRVGGTPDDPQYYIRPGAADRPTTMAWRHAARYANWLHNDQAPERWAFEDGAYDTSTFGYNNDGTFTDQPEHHPDARFWIPTLDEYAKAMFWDPGKDGGEGGYWRYPHSKDTVPISGAPWDGGETDAGADPDDFPPLDAGSYPWAASPWGLLGGSGGQAEWTEHVADGHYDRVWHGSRAYGLSHDGFDRLDFWTATDPAFSDFGIRFASSVPTPGVLAVPVIACMTVSSSRRVALVNSGCATGGLPASVPVA